MAVFETWLRSDLKKPMRVVELSGNLFSADNGGNLIGVEVLDGGQAASLSGNVYGYIIRADGATVLVNGTLTGNRATIVLPASAYLVIGQVSIVIKVGDVTVGACVAQVYRTSTDTLVDPANVIPSISELLEAIDDCEQATADANSAATLANTKAGLADEKATLADQKATLANTAAGTANTAAAAANTAAGKIDNMTVAASSSSTPTATITEVDGHKHIAFGLVQGNPGKDFHIQKTFASIAAMQAYDPDQDPSASKVTANDFVMIDTGSVQDADTGKLFCYEPETQDIWRYIGDLSGSQGIKGETGTGIANIVLNADYTLTITMDDGSTSYTTGSIRGAQGAQGPIGPAAYVHIRYAATQPTQDSDMSTTPNDWMGIYSGAASTAPTAYTDYAWYKIKGETGSVSNMYGTTIPMSEQDSTKIATAIGNKLDANQGSGNTGKFMRVGAAGAVAYDNPTERYASVSNFPATGDAGKLYIAEDTGMIYVWDTNEYKSVGGSEIPDFTGATSSAAGAHGLVPAPAVADKDKFLKGNGGWAEVPNPQVMTGATASSAGTSGLVPAPAAGDQDKVLYGDGTWKIPGGGTLRVVPFSIGVASWTLANGVYSYTVSSAYVTATSVEFIEYDSSFRAAVRGDVNATKATGGGGVTFTTDVLPVATLSGEIRVFDSDDGTVAIVTQMTALPTMREVPFTVAVSGWALNADDLYEAVFTTAYVTATSHDFVEFDESIENATDGIKVSKAESSGSVVGLKFLSRRIPAGAISGTITPLDNADGKIAVALEDTVMPIANGGTGANTLAGAQQNLGITALQEDVEELNNKLIPGTTATEIATYTGTGDQTYNVTFEEGMYGIYAMNGLLNIRYAGVFGFGVLSNETVTSVMNAGYVPAGTHEVRFKGNASSSKGVIAKLF